MAETFDYDRLTVDKLWDFIDRIGSDVPIVVIGEDRRELKINDVRHVETIDNDEYIEIHIKKTAQPIS